MYICTYMPALEFLLFFSCKFNQSDHPDANQIQVPWLAFVKAPLPWCLLFPRFSGDLGQNTRSHASMYVLTV